MSKRQLSSVRIVLYVALAAALSGLSPGTAAGEEATWRVIASDSFIFRGRIQTMDLGTAQSFVRGLKVRTHGPRMTFSSLRVRYAGGRPQPVRRRIRLGSGEESQQIPVPEDGKFVDEIVLIPDVSAPRRARIRVEILGLQTETDARRIRGAPPPPVSTGDDDAQSEKKSDKKSGKPATADGPTADAADRETADARPDDRTETAAATAGSGPARDNPAAMRMDPEQKPEAPPAPSPAERTALGTPPTKGGGLLLASSRLSRDGNAAGISLDDRAGQFRSLALRLSGSNVFIEAVTVRYRDGSQSRARFGTMLFRNTRSRWFSTEPDRLADALEIAYRPVDGDSGANARIDVLGHVADDWLAPNGRARRLDPQGWMLIAAGSSGQLRRAGGRLPAARNRGGYGALRVVAGDRVLQNASLIVAFADGDERRLEPGSTRRGADAQAEGIAIGHAAPIEHLQLAVSDAAWRRLGDGQSYEVWVRF